MSAHPVNGALLMTGGCALLTVNDAFMKTLVNELPLGEVVGLRALAGFVMILAVTPLTGGWRQLRPRNPGPVAIMTGLMLLNFFLLPFSLRFVPLADALILASASPIIVAALSPWMLGEHVGVWRWSAVVIGLVGAALLVMPEGSAFHWAILGPVVVSITIGLREILTRRYIAVESVLSLVALAHLATAVVGVATLPFEWQAMDVRQVGMLLGSAAFLTVSQLMIVASFRHADAAVLSCLKYSTVVWAALFGWLIWRETLGLAGWTGAVLIIISGITITLRSQPAPK